MKVAHSDKTCSTVALVCASDRAEARLVARNAVTWLLAHGHRPIALHEDIDAPKLSDIQIAVESVDAADLVLSIGGDGTMLRAVSLIGESAIPVLGVNVGHLGYLAEVEPESVDQALDRFFAGDFTTENRLVLDVSVRHCDGSHSTYRALNEASFEKTRSGQTVRLGVSIDEVPFTTYQADGLLVATPTGSTAYALSARGPIVSPAHEAILVTPLAPHMLFDRTLVLDATESVEIEVVGQRSVVVAVDGQERCTLEPGDRVRCVAAPKPAVFVRLDPMRFHQVLKSKFGLSDR